MASRKKKQLCLEIADAVRKIQKLYISSQNSARSCEDSKTKGAGLDLSREVEQLCVAVEAVFLHELKNSKCVLWREARKPNQDFLPEPSFWVCIEPMVQDEIKTQLLALRNSESDVRKCRSWVRLMLSKHLMVGSLEDMQRHPGLIGFYYGEGALLRDQEQSEVIIQLLRGLTVLQLPYDYTSSKLDRWEPASLMLAGIWEGPRPIPVSPTPSSPSVQRVSPPTSDFEGVAIIGMAMDKYHKRRSSKLSDSELISQEISERLNPVPKRSWTEDSRGGSNSFSSLEGGNIESQPFGAILRSHAQKAESLDKTDDDIETGVMGRAWSPEGKGEGSDGSVNSVDYSIALSMDYEVISSEGSLMESQKHDPHQKHKQVMVEHLVKLMTEKGLDSQNYKCCGCNRDIGLIFGQAKLCKFNGQHYCYECHRDDERVIPARVLFNWDFRLHKVCLASCEFLDSVELSPILDMEKINKALYLYIPALEESLKLRIQCKHLQDYLMSCKDQEPLGQFQKRLKHSHICENVYLHSIKDLMDINSGVFSERLRKLVKFGIKHVKQCPLCSQKGFICEMCHDSQVIYPFDLKDTAQCDCCKALYHQECSPEKGNCPKCLRIQRRTADSASLQ